MLQGTREVALARDSMIDSQECRLHVAFHSQPFLQTRGDQRLQKLFVGASFCPGTWSFSLVLPLAKRHSVQPTLNYRSAVHLNLVPVVIYNETYVLLIMRYIPTTATTILLSIAVMFATLLLLAAPFVMGQSDIPLSQDIQSVLAVNNNSLYHYPTDLTQGIMPKNVHSHNDYWRAKPFYTALSNGVISVEADVWLYNGTLYVCKFS